jgi:putative N6-adenine-specific DNA methylase
MANPDEFEIFLMCPPGLEDALYDEVRAHRFRAAKKQVAGVSVRGTWKDAWRANLELRGTGRVMAEIANFRAPTLPELERRARNIDWVRVLKRDVPVRVEATCKKSKIYHSGAAEQRVADALKEELGAPVSDDADVCVRVRLENDICHIGVDTSGDLLHKRGFKEAVNKAPMRETMAALFLRQCGYRGTEPVVDPMCGSGTFIIEAAEIAAGLKPGRERKFAFEHLAGFDPEAWQRMKTATAATVPAHRFYGSDRDAGAITMSRANAERAGVSAFCDFQHHAISELAPPAGPPGLVIVNPPYGKRIGDTKSPLPLYRALGAVLLEKFSGWRVGLVTNEKFLAEATGLPLLPPPAPVAHGGIRVTLYQTAALP